MKKHAVGDAIIYEGDCLDVLPQLESAFVHLCITSPPYFGLRDYETGQWEGGDVGCSHKPDVRRRAERPRGKLVGSTETIDAGNPVYRSVCARCGAKRIDAQIGLEETPVEYVDKLVQVFRQVRRLLRDDGIFVLNVGDSFAGGGGGNYSKGTRNNSKQNLTNVRNRANWLEHANLKPKDMMGVPWTVALALRDDGWYLRQAFPWANRSKMPESCTDRPSSALEYIFMFAKSEDYFWDAEAVKQSQAPASQSRYRYGFGGKKNETLIEMDKEGIGNRTRVVGERQFDESGRNLRNTDFWFQSIQAPHGLVGWGDDLVGLDVTTESFCGEHYAVFPTALVKPFVLAGTSQKGCCSECGKPWQRILKKERRATRPGKDTKVKSKDSMKVGNRDPARHVTTTETLGWEAGCACHADVVPCTVLDPFAGTFTTAVVAQRLGRKSIGIELNPKSIEDGIKRLQSRGGYRGKEPPSKRKGLAY